MPASPSNPATLQGLFEQHIQVLKSRAGGADAFERQFHIPAFQRIEGGFDHWHRRIDIQSLAGLTGLEIGRAGDRQGWLGRLVVAQGDIGQIDPQSLLGISSPQRDLGWKVVRPHR